MFPRKTLLWVSLALLFCFAGSASAQDVVYNEETVWAITFVKTEPGRFDDYMANLNGLFRKVNDQAMKDGLVLSYKIISANSTYPGDWDLMLMVEYKNMAAFDGLADKFRALINKMASEEQQEEGIQSRAKVRTILGNKLGRELSFK